MAPQSRRGQARSPSAFPGRVSTQYIILFDVHTYQYHAPVPYIHPAQIPIRRGNMTQQSAPLCPAQTQCVGLALHLYRPCRRSSPLPAGRTTRRRHFNTMYRSIHTAVHTRHPVPYRPPDHPVLPALTCTWTWTSSQAFPPDDASKTSRELGAAVYVQYRPHLWRTDYCTSHILTQDAPSALVPSLGARYGLSPAPSW